MLLLHGTTRHRAELILRNGPDPDYQEPGEPGRAESFSTCVEAGPFPLGRPEWYAVQKSKAFPHEGGPVILAIDVPESIIERAVSNELPLSGGVVQFDRGHGLEELIQNWAGLAREIRPVAGNKR